MLSHIRKLLYRSFRPIIIQQNIIYTEQTARIFFAACINLWGTPKNKRGVCGDKNVHISYLYHSHW